LRDLWARRRWRRQESVRPLRALAPVARRIASDGCNHLHAHFADEAGLDALRLGRLLSIRFSVTAHAYEIFARPANLREKLSSAAFVTTGCRYNVDYLRGLVEPATRDRIHEVVMGVDARCFARSRPRPGGRHVVAVGRLVPKKGFRHLIEAAAILAEEGAGLERVSIAGAGPCGDELAALARERGLSETVSLLGELDPDAVRELLEGADVLVAPSVIAADGDRDSMPVVVKEALAMEVPVVASDLAGLPEVVRPRWGRLVPPGDSHGLASVIAAVLELPVGERQEMGRAGRAWALDHGNADLEAAKLDALIRAAATGRPSGNARRPVRRPRAPRDRRARSTA
jgi:glycosyltransferase involved in cell wall biosynthesis